MLDSVVFGLEAKPILLSFIIFHPFLHSRIDLSAPNYNKHRWLSCNAGGGGMGGNGCGHRLR